MRRTLFATAIGTVFLLTAACGDSNSGDDDDDDDDDDDIVEVDAGTVDPDAATAGFENLISRSWTIPPGFEGYKCTLITVPEDMYISAIRPLGPSGTHHTVLSVEDSDQADGDYDCVAASLAPQMLFASGVGSDDLVFPEGVGLRLRAGQKLGLNLHLYNTTDADLSGTSGNLVKIVDSVEQEAEALFSGPAFSLAIADTPEPTPQEFSHRCTFDQAATLVAIWPHQHKLGTHHKFQIHRAGGAAEVLLDEDYSFEEQKNYPLDPLVQVAAGEEVETTCTYVNQTGAAVGFGDSSDAEMCFTGIYRYPATGADIFSCTDLPFFP